VPQNKENDSAQACDQGKKLEKINLVRNNFLASRFFNFWAIYNLDKLGRSMMIRIQERSQKKNMTNQKFAKTHSNAVFAECERILLHPGNERASRRAVER
jgi:hypothetical protein